MRDHDNIEEYPEDLEDLKAEDWQLELLKANPSYTCWGNFEDYMSKDGRGWDSRQKYETWKDFGPWELDELNEVVNFYFEVSRKSHNCPVCDGKGSNAETRELERSFYDFENTGKAWYDKITQDEVEALQAEGRLTKYVDGKRTKVEGLTAEEVNEANSKRGLGLGDYRHDAINRWILIKTRAKRLGIYGLCSNCQGKGTIYDEDKAHVSLQLWMLHPRKGCSRGIFIERIEKSELPAVKKFLMEAAERNQERFNRIASL